METKFNFKSQVCTDKIQSERLLELGLKKETADMEWFHTKSFGWSMMSLDGEDIIQTERHIPAWSLHRLLYLLPICVESYRLAISESHIEYRTSYDDVTIWWRSGGNIYDMIVETIEWLIKEEYFPKEYLV